MSTPAANPLDAFLPPIRAWFTATLGEPTPPQAQGWPAIQRGENTLIMAPTGSGKTLTSFLWGIDQIFRALPAPQPVAPGTGADKPKRRARKADDEPAGIHLIYISPLKALNNDIERNLRGPLAGIRRTAEAAGQELPEISVAVRSGDTPSRERQAMLRKAPHILITTPESLYILLTSPRARELFRTVRTLIVDEIHTLAGSKRGVHLAISLERLQHLAAGPVQRIGLSATIRPLAEVARYLGGNEVVAAQAGGAPRTRRADYTSCG
jgi:ATP-dependent Lhr-like helicase